MVLEVGDLWGRYFGMLYRQSENRRAGNEGVVLALFFCSQNRSRKCGTEAGLLDLKKIQAEDCHERCPNS